MGDKRFVPYYERIRSAGDQTRALQELSDEEVIQALAASSEERDPYLANVLATEAMNRMRRNRAITTHLAEGALAVGCDLVITFTNETLTQLLGGGWADYTGRPIDEALVMRDMEGRIVTGTSLCPITQCLADGHTREWDGEVSGRSGIRIPASFNVAPIVREGEIEGVVAAFRDVTERRRALVALQDSEQRFRSLVDANPLGVFAIDTGGTVLDINPSAERIIGRPASALIGTTMADHLPEHEHERVLANLADVLSGITRTDEYDIFHANGELLRVRVTGIPMRVGGEVVGAHCIGEDVTEERRRERALRKSEEMHRRLVDAVSDHAMFLVGADGRIASWNLGAERLMGYAAGDVVGQPFSIVFSKELARAGHPEEELRAAERDGTHLHTDTLRRRADGSLFPAATTLSAIRDSAGNLLAYLEVTRDLTERKRNDERVRARDRQHAVVARIGMRALEGVPLQALFDDVVESLSGSLDLGCSKVLQLDPDGNAFTIRAAHGWDESIVPGTTKVSAGHGSQAGYTLVTSGPVVVRDLLAETRFHEPTLLLGQGIRSGVTVVIHGAHGPWGVLGAFSKELRDFGEDDVNLLQSLANVLAHAIARHDAEDRLERRVVQRTAELQSALRDLETFASTVSHDLRAPLRGVSFLAQELRASPSLSPGDNELADRLVAECGRATRLVHDVLDFSRSRSERLALSEVDLAPMARDIAREIDELNPSYQTRWDIAERLIARCDPHLMRIVLRNLMDNAAKYSSASSPARAVVAMRETEDERILTVQDNGIGFDPAHSSRLFTPFSRLANATGYEGTGLGLATVQRIVERHGGRVWAEAQPGTGATFSVALPK